MSVVCRQKRRFVCRQCRFDALTKVASRRGGRPSRRRLVGNSRRFKTLA